MNQDRNGAVPNNTVKKESTPVIKILIVGCEICLVAILLVLWLTSPSIRQSKNLWVLFFYSFPSMFLIAIVPHEPVLLYFSKFYSPVSVALVAISGVLLTEALNYTVFKFFADLKLSKKLLKSKIVTRLVDLFKKYPFIVLWVAGFTPVPFYPFRFLVILARYPLWKYLLVVFLSRTPRFYILALIGYVLKIPNSLIIIIFIGITILIYLPLIRNALKKK